MNPLFERIISLFLLMLLGVFVNKRKMISEQGIKDLSKLIFNICFPALIIVTMNKPFNKELFFNSFYLLILGITTYTVLIFYSMFISKALKFNDNNAFTFMSTFGNVTYMGFPILMAIFGERSDLALFYASLFNFGHTFIFWTIGILILDKKNHKIQFKSLLNPGIFSIVTGYSLFLMQIKLPVVLKSTLNTIGMTSIPLSMIVIGFLLANIKIKNLFELRTIIILIQKSIIVPIALILILIPFNLGEIPKMIIPILLGVPCSINSVIVLKKYDSDYDFAAKATLLTTIFSLFTIQIVARLAGSNSLQEFFNRFLNLIN